MIIPELDEPLLGPIIAGEQTEIQELLPDQTSGEIMVSASAERQIVQQFVPEHLQEQQELRSGLKKVTAAIEGRRKEFIVAGWVPIFGNHFVYRITERLPDGTKRHRYVASARTWQEAMKHATRWVQTPYGETKGKSTTVNLNRRARIRDPRTMRLIPLDQLMMSPTFNQIGIDVMKLARALPDTLVAGMIEVHGTAEASKYYQMWLQEKDRADDIEMAYNNFKRNTEKRVHVLAEALYKDLVMGLEAAMEFARAATLRGNWWILMLIFLVGIVLGITVDRAVLAFVEAQSVANMFQILGILSG